MQTLEQQLYRELVLDKRLHEIFEEIWQVSDENQEELSDLQKERLALQLELGQLRLDLYLRNRDFNAQQHQ